VSWPIAEVSKLTRPNLGELRAKAQSQMIARVDASGSARTDGEIDDIVAFVDAYAWSKSDGGIFNSGQHALWRLFQSLAATNGDNGWDNLRNRVTGILEGAGCWERIGGERGSQWWLRRRWGVEPTTPSVRSEPVCRFLDGDNECRDGITDPRFCSRCATPFR